MDRTIFTCCPIGMAVLVAVVGLAGCTMPADAATVEWRVGPLQLAAGQAAQVGIGDPEIFPCRVGVEIRAGQIGTRAFPMPVLVNTIGDPDIVPAGNGVIVGVYDPNETPGTRTLVQARVQAVCPAGTAAQVRRLPVAMTIVDRASGRAGATLQGVAQ